MEGHVNTRLHFLDSGWSLRLLATCCTYVLYSVLGAMDPSLSWTRTRTIITDSRGAPVSFQGYPWLIGGSARRILPALLSLPHGGTGVCLAPLLPLDACLSTEYSIWVWMGVCARSPASQRPPESECVFDQSYPWLSSTTVA